MAAGIMSWAGEDGQQLDNATAVLMLAALCYGIARAVMLPRATPLPVEE
jgi:hypothetical protein